MVDWMNGWVGEENRERMKEQIAGEYINGWMKLWINKLMVPWSTDECRVDGWMDGCLGSGWINKWIEE